MSPHTRLTLIPADTAESYQPLQQLDLSATRRRGCPSPEGPMQSNPFQSTACCRSNDNSASGRGRGRGRGGGMGSERGEASGARACQVPARGRELALRGGGPAPGQRERQGSQPGLLPAAGTGHGDRGPHQTNRVPGTVKHRLGAQPEGPAERVRGRAGEGRPSPPYA